MRSTRHKTRRITHCRSHKHLKAEGYYMGIGIQCIHSIISKQQSKIKAKTLDAAPNLPAVSESMPKSWAKTNEKVDEYKSAVKVVTVTAISSTMVGTFIHLVGDSLASDDCVLVFCHEKPDLIVCSVCNVSSVCKVAAFLSLSDWVPSPCAGFKTQNKGQLNVIRVLSTTCFNIEAKKFWKNKVKWSHDDASLRSKTLQFTY